MDLYPCTPSELKSVGYKEIAKQHVSSLPPSMLAMKESLLDDDKNKKPLYPDPDVLQMIPFKPRQIYPTGAHPVPGGVFPPPPSASYLMTLLPPPSSFQGPFVGVDDLIRVIKMWRPPENAPKPSMENGISKDMEKYFEHAINAMGDKKRKLGDGVNDESDEDEGGLIPPVKDVYRARQQKKVK